MSCEAEPLSVRDSPPVLVETEKIGSEPDSDMLTDHELTGNILVVLVRRENLGYDVQNITEIISSVKSEV